MSTFEKLAASLRNALPDFGYSNATEIQKKAIPKILGAANDNFLISAPTGSGKTEAALFPILTPLLDREEGVNGTEGFSLLYIAPLRALNRDILQRMLPLLTKKLGISMSVRNSDTSSYKRRKQAKTPPDILVTTPETFQILFCGKLLRDNLKAVEWVVVDEFHSIMDSKRGVQLSVGLERLRRLTDYRTVGLGAGITNKRKALNFLTGGREGEIIESEKKREYAINVQAVRPNLKLSDSPLGFEQEVKLREITDRIAKIVKEVEGKVLVFSNTRTTVELIGAFMKSDHSEILSAVHHSSLGTDVRREVERDFKSGSLDCVIATSSLELGIDIGECDLVIQVLSPRRIEIALQRIGRSRHSFGETARGIIIAGTPDSLFESIGIAELSGKKLEPKRIPRKSYDVLAHQIVGMLRGQYIEEEEYLNKRDIYETVQGAWPYRNLSKQEFNEVLNFLDRRARLININGRSLSLSSGAIPYYFNHLSTIPTVVKYDVMDMGTNEKIGELDQKFVLDVEAGDVFLLSGLPREILEIQPEEGKILTRPAGASALPPKWEGEMIPVSWELAEYVGELRKEQRTGEALGDLPVDTHAKKWMKEILDTYPHEKKFPDPKNIVVEADASRGIVIMHSPFGTKVNNTLSILLGEFLQEDRDFPLVNVDSDRYRVLLHTFESDFLKEKSMFKALERAMNKIIDYSLDKQEFKRLVYNTVISSNTTDLAWYLIQILNRFGVLDAGTRLKKGWIERLVSKYRDTPVLREAVREYTFAHMEVTRTRKLLQEIGKEREMWFTKGISSLGMGGPANFSTDVADTDRLINKKYEERLLEKKLKFVCLSCGYHEIRAAKDPLRKCPRCSSMLISVSKRHKNLEELVKKADEGELNEEEKKRFSLAHRVARSLKSTGTLTSKVIATTGIGSKQALAIMKKYSADEEKLIEELRKRERHYWQYHHIWEDET